MHHVNTHALTKRQRLDEESDSDVQEVYRPSTFVIARGQFIDSEKVDILRVDFCQKTNTLQVSKSNSWIRVPLDNPSLIIGQIEKPYPTESYWYAEETKRKLFDKNKLWEKPLFEVTEMTSNHIRIDSAREPSFWIEIRNALRNHRGTEVSFVSVMHPMGCHDAILSARTTANLMYAIKTDQRISFPFLNNVITYLSSNPPPRAFELMRKNYHPDLLENMKQSEHPLARYVITRLFADTFVASLRRYETENNLLPLDEYIVRRIVELAFF